MGGGALGSHLLSRAARPSPSSKCGSHAAGCRCSRARPVYPPPACQGHPVGMENGQQSVICLRSTMGSFTFPRPRSALFLAWTPNKTQQSLCDGCSAGPAGLVGRQRLPEVGLLLAHLCQAEPSLPRGAEAVNSVQRQAADFCDEDTDLGKAETAATHIGAHGSLTVL